MVSTKKHGLSRCKIFCGCGADDGLNARKSYYCSDLVACIYKIMGITTTDDKSTIKYMPGGFEGTSINLKLCCGAHLGGELLVDFYLE